MYTNTPWWVPGVALTVMGLMIVLFPELLAMMVATLMLMVGVGWLAIGWTTRRNPRKEVPVYVYRQDRWDR